MLIILPPIFVLGLIFQNGHHVQKEPLVGEFKTGGVLAFKYADLALSFVERTREFKGQAHDDRYGSLSINVKF